MQEWLSIINCANFASRVTVVDGRAMDRDDILSITWDIGRNVDFKRQAEFHTRDPTTRNASDARATRKKR